jgi:flagellar protein FliO/FliZ
MSQSFAAFAPALGLLVLMGLLAWGVQWFKKRTSPTGTGLSADLRLVSQLMVGPQQRVVVVELQGPEGPVQLTLGITPQQIQTLHTQKVNVAASYQQVAAGLEATPLQGQQA